MCWMSTSGVFVGEEQSVFTAAACLWLQASTKTKEYNIFLIHLSSLRVSCSCSEPLLSGPLPPLTLFLSFYRCWSAFPRWRSSPLPLDLLQAREQLCPLDWHRSVASHLARLIYLQPSWPTGKKSAILKSFCHFSFPFPLSQRSKSGQSVEKSLN